MAHQSITHEGLPAGYDSWRTSGPYDRQQGDEHDTPCPDCKGQGWGLDDDGNQDPCVWCYGDGLITEPCPEHCADHCDCFTCNYRD